MDEAAYVHPSMINSAILPISKRENTAVLMITTDKENGSTEDFEKIAQAHPGDLLGCLRFSKVCNDCIETKDLQIVTKCKHLCMFNPQFHSGEREQMLSEIYNQTNSTEVFFKENLSLMWFNTKKTFFSAAQVKKLCFPQHDTYSKLDDLEVREITVGIDPSGGGRSDFALVALTYNQKDKTQRVGIFFLFFFFVGLAELSDHFVCVCVCVTVRGDYPAKQRVVSIG